MATVQPDQIPADQIPADQIPGLIGCCLVVLFLGWAFWFLFIRDNRNND